MTDVSDTLAERGDRYGKFIQHAEVSQLLKRVCYARLLQRRVDIEADQKEAIEMICHKLARIVNGDPGYSDSWRDIAGYAMLVSNRLDGLTDNGEKDEQ